MGGASRFYSTRSPPPQEGQDGGKGCGYTYTVQLDDLYLLEGLR